MNINPGMIDQLLNSIPYPIAKGDLIKMAQQHGANDQMTGLLNRLPDKTYNNADELKSDVMGAMGNLGGFKI